MQEPVKELGIFPHYKMCMEAELAADLRQLVKSGHGYLDLVADTAHLQQYVRRLCPCQYSAYPSYHVVI